MATGTASPDLSVTIITKNEAHRIGRCLASVSFADEIIVLDSGSTDDTVAIARAAGAKVSVTDWPGFGVQKNRALALATGRWVLSIDADEQVTPALRDEMLAVVRGANAEGACEGWWLRRESTFCGQPIRHGDWSNDRVLRLFLRERARFSDDRVHERVLCDGPTGRLRGVLLHDTVDTLADAYAKAIDYAIAGAERVRARGRGGRGAALSHAAWTFLRGYLVRGGFRDGGRGWQLARCNTLGTYLRYRLAALDDVQRTQLVRVWARRVGVDAFAPD